jgi:exopolysaccharide biosynthesis polyprenyl glycosylphosphotransferase
MIDSLASVVILYLASDLRILIGNLPAQFIQYLSEKGIAVGGAPSIISSVNGVPLPVFAFVGIIWPLVFATLHVYDGRRNSTIQAELSNILISIIVSIILLSGMLFMTYRETSRLMLALFVVMDIVFLEGSRLILWLFRKIHNGKGKVGRKSVLVVGAGVVGQNVVAQLQHYGWGDFYVSGYLDDDSTKQNKLIANLPVLGKLDQVDQVVKREKIQHAIVALPPWAHVALINICQKLQKLNVAVNVVPDLFALSFPNASLDGFGGIPVINLGQAGINGWQRLRKRVFDIIVATIILLLISPLFGLIALLIIIDTKGPIFYRQMRIGEHGRLFSMLKFRSMYINSDTDIHRTHVQRLIIKNLSPEQLNGNKNSSLKLIKDSRITRVGQVIRKISLDELPQLINVLRGEMSLVGPRPPLVYEMDVYKEWHKKRLDVLPGVTGIWQVRGRNWVSFDEMVRMDLDYIEHQSLWLDFKILLQTPWAVLHARGAG